MSELPAGQVTIGDLYREIVGMRTDVGKALTRIEVIDVRNNDADRVHADHEARLRALEAAPDVPPDIETRVRGLEKLAWKLIGAFAAVNAVAIAAEYMLLHK